jgi:hypothetical protein
MADQITARKGQSKAEIRIWDFDFTDDCIGGVTVVSATAAHIPPSGIATVPVVGTVLGNVVPVKLGPLSIKGRHYLQCLATLSNTEKSEILLKIIVRF